MDTPTSPRRHPVSRPRKQIPSSSPGAVARWVVAAGLVLGCRAQPAAPEPGSAGRIGLFETVPAETTLGAGDWIETHEAWLAAIDGARSELRLFHFYASDSPNAEAAPTRLGAVVLALERAAARGVRIDFLLSENFRQTYPELPARLDQVPGIEVRFLDLRPHGGSVQHAKWMTVDRTRSLLGSANFDWRALEHIQELGVQVESAEITAALDRVFLHDWALAGGQTLDEARALSAGPSLEDPVELHWASSLGASPIPVRARAIFSPRGLLPEGLAFDLPYLLAALDGARTSICVQVMTYRLQSRDGQRFTELDDALRRAAARGVRVRLLVADWGKRANTVGGLKALAQVPGIEVRFLSIPVASTGFVPFSRVSHPKLLVVDEELAWIGTSNWEGDYFEKSRNGGLLLESVPLAKRLAEWFEGNWSSPYGEVVDPDREYSPPRISE